VSRYENNAAFEALLLILWLGEKIMQLLETLSCDIVARYENNAAFGDFFMDIVAR
jgi:hypothetical protein